MKAVFYRLLVCAAKLLGPWFFILVAKGVATGYFIFSARRRRIGRRFYAALFPERDHTYHLFCTWKQFLHFTYVYLDRFVQREIQPIRYTVEGRQYVTGTFREKKGGILLMSHMGNWEMAAHLLTKVIPDLKLMLYMGIQDKEEIEKIQKQSVRQDGIRVIGVSQDGGSPLDIVEGLHFLQSGGLVSMAGDMVWRGDQRTISGTFLNHCVNLPEAPFVLALLSGAPLIVFFAFRTAAGTYRFSAMPPIRVSAPTRDKRLSAIRAAAQTYLAHMESALRQHPFEWYHFDRFLEGTSVNR